MLVMDMILDAVVLRSVRLVQEFEFFLQRVGICTIIRCTSLPLAKSFPFNPLIYNR